MSQDLEKISKSLSDTVSAMEFGDPVAFVYNPLQYAWKPHSEYLRRFGQKKGRILMVGMNPGPFGMAQTGVPFGDVDLVKDWMGIEEDVGKPPAEHPKRPVEGFEWHRNEVSGGRLWGWARDRFGDADNFFDHFYVHNYVPLLFVHESGRNVTPNKVPIAERRPLLAAAGQALRDVVETLEPRRVVGIGAFAEKQSKSALKGMDVEIGRILHPSPASPKANKGWVGFAEEEFAEQGIDIDVLASG
jgi:single-strand selective monofunctional uracil DNA glycosylase